MSGVTVWIEPDARRHPLVGITQALALADGRPVLVCGADLPFVSPTLVRRLARANPGRAPAVIACTRGEMQPLLGCYQRRALPLLSGEAQVPTCPVRETIAAIDPVLFEVDDPEELFDVDSPDDLLQAAAMLDRRRYRIRLLTAADRATASVPRPRGRAQSPPPQSGAPSSRT